jgi:hypothetical protein
LKDRPVKVISCIFGGMGDHLLLSTLPRRFDEVRSEEAPDGYDVYMHDGELTRFRNSEIKDLIMRNPHIKGFSSRPPNAGHGVYVDIWGRFCWESRLRSADPIALMEEVNGLPSPYSHAPEIYPELVPVNTNDGVILIDPYSSSLPFTQDSVGPWVEFYQGHYPGKTFHVVETPGYAAFHRALFGFPKIEAKSLAEYIGLLRSAHAFFGVESGGQMLAAAVKNSIRPELKVHALFSTRGYNQKFYRLHESVVQTDVTGFAIQNDFAIDPGQLGYRHIVETGTFAQQTNAAEAAVPVKPLQAADLIAVPNSPQHVGNYGDDQGFPIQSEASM